LLLVVVFGFSSGLVAADQEKFKSFSSTVPGRVEDLIIGDLDQDGLLDVFIVWVEGEYPAYKRGITVYFQTGRGFSHKSRQDFEVDDSVALVDFGQVDGEPGLDIACLCRGSVSYYPLRGRRYGKLTRLAEARPFTAFADQNSLPYYNFLQDWNRDGRDELLLLEFERSLLFPAGENGLEPVGREIMLFAHIDINIGGPERIFQEHHSLRSFYFMPQLNAEDYDGDGRVDLIGTYRGKLTIFRQLEDGGFSREPTWEVQITLPRPPDKEGKRDRGEPMPPMIQIDDVNDDGRMDVIAGQIVGSFGELKSQTYIFYGHTDSIRKNRHDQLIEREQAGSLALLRDLDGNGTMDLVVPYIKIDILNIAKMIITSSIDVNFAIYTIDKNGRYPDAPTGEDATSIKLNVREFTVEGGVPNVDGDFDNDGINDVVLGKNQKEIHVLKGNGLGVFDDENPLAVIPVDSPLFPDVFDLNADGLADIVVSYIPYHDNDHKIFVFMNNGAGAEARSGN
jgi:hypothetical protein